MELNDDILKSIARTEAYSKNLFFLYLNSHDETSEQQIFNERYREAIEEDTDEIYNRLKNSIQ